MNKDVQKLVEVLRHTQLPLTAENLALNYQDPKMDVRAFLDDTEHRLTVAWPTHPAVPVLRAWRTGTDEAFQRECETAISSRSALPKGLEDRIWKLDESGPQPYEKYAEGCLNLTPPLSPQAVVKFRALEGIVGRGTLATFFEVPEEPLCWVISDDGGTLVPSDKTFRFGRAWLEWLIRHIFEPNNVRLTGCIVYQGEEFGDAGALFVYGSRIKDKSLEALAYAYDGGEED